MIKETKEGQTQFCTACEEKAHYGKSDEKHTCGLTNPPTPSDVLDREVEIRAEKTNSRAKIRTSLTYALPHNIAVSDSDWEIIINNIEGLMIDVKLEAEATENQAWLNRHRCFSCGKAEMLSDTADWCHECFEEN